MDTFTENIRGVANLVESEINKVTNTGNINPEGQTGLKVDVLDLPMSDEELLKLRDTWEKMYGPYESRLLPLFKRNLRAYLGQSREGSILELDQPGAANLQFEAEETFLAAALAENPDPLVYSDNTPEGNKIADAVKTMLQFHADQLILRRKLATMVRQWSIYQLGVLKHGWNEEVNDVCVENRKIQDFVFDPNGYIDAYGDFTSWMGERIHCTAEKLVELFPKHKEYISQIVEGKLGTEVTYTEWWTDKYCFTTFKEKVLDKHKNQYFNYEEDSGELDELGMPLMTKPYNHFAQPKKPYTFLSVFSLQERPHDITGLIEQNIPNQAKITKRVEQIDAQVSQAVNGIAFSEANFNQETAKQAANALSNPSKGKVLVPAGGPIGEAIVRIAAPNVPESAFSDLENSENHLKSSWGIQGIVSEPQKSDTTARGMILNQGRDTTRIGGGVGDAIEQVAKNVFNWLVQLYEVFYDEPHFATVMGIGKATEYVVLSAKDIDRQVIVSVAANSMKPKDEVTRMNMAQNLYSIGAIGPKTLLENLDFPNPDESAGDGVLWKLDPVSYMRLNFPELVAQIQQMAMGQPVQSMGAPQPNAPQPGNVANVQSNVPNPPSVNPASAALSQIKMPQ